MRLMTPRSAADDIMACFCHPEHRQINAPGDTIVVPEKLDKGVVLRGSRIDHKFVSTVVISAGGGKSTVPIALTSL